MLFSDWTISTSILLRSRMSKPCKATILPAPSVIQKFPTQLRRFLISVCRSYCWPRWENKIHHRKCQQNTNRSCRYVRSIFSSLLILPTSDPNLIITPEKFTSLGHSKTSRSLGMPLYPSSLDRHQARYMPAYVPSAVECVSAHCSYSDLRGGYHDICLAHVCLLFVRVIGCGYTIARNFSKARC